jgi:hypothetical protein
MLIRLARILAFILGLVIVTPCIIEWILIGRNTGSMLMEWAIDVD